VLLTRQKWLSNIIMHPTRHKEIGLTQRCFGRVMMSVREMGVRQPRLGVV